MLDSHKSVPAQDPETGAARIVEPDETRVPKRFRPDPVHDIQVPCPMNGGAAGASSLNIELPARERRLERFSWAFVPSGKDDADRERLRQGGP